MEHLGYLSFLDFFLKVKQTTCKDFAISVVLFVICYWLLSLYSDYSGRYVLFASPVYAYHYGNFYIKGLLSLSLHVLILTKGRQTHTYTSYLLWRLLYLIFHAYTKKYKNSFSVANRKITMYRDGVYQLLHLLNMLYMCVA